MLHFARAELQKLRLLEFFAANSKAKIPSFRILQEPAQQALDGKHQSKKQKSSMTVQ